MSHFLLNLALAVPKGLFADHRANARLQKSLKEDEQILGRWGAQNYNGIFDHPGGILWLTNTHLRFEKTISTLGAKIAKGSWEVQLDKITQVTVTTHLAVYAKVVVATQARTTSFAFMAWSRAEEVKRAILAAIEKRSAEM